MLKSSEYCSCHEYYVHVRVRVSICKNHLSAEAKDVCSLCAWRQSFSWDEGACYAPKEIWNSTMLVHWGNTNTKHNASTTAYWADTWNPISSERRGNHPCFDPDKDLVIPSWKIPDVHSLNAKLWARCVFLLDLAQVICLDLFNCIC